MIVMTTGEQMKDELGLTLTDMGDVIEAPPFIVPYGPAGFGKSTEIAKSFVGRVGEPGALFLLTQKTVLRPYQS